MRTFAKIKDKIVGVKCTDCDHRVSLDKIGGCDKCGEAYCEDCLEGKAVCSSCINN